MSTSEPTSEKRGVWRVLIGVLAVQALALGLLWLLQAWYDV